MTSVDGSRNLCWSSEELADLPTAIVGRQDLRLFMRLDMVAHGVTSWSIVDSLKNPQLWFQRALRRYEYSLVASGRRPWRRLVAASRYRIVSMLTGISIPPGVFGPGLSIAHHGGLVVNAGAKAGAFVHVNAFVTIGASGGGSPRIGNFVFVGAGATVIGAVTVGDAAAVGAGAVVTRDVPPHSTAIGVPAEIRSENGSAEHLPDWFPRYEVHR